MKLFTKFKTLLLACAFMCVSSIAQNSFEIGGGNGGNNSYSREVITHKGIRYSIMPKSSNHDAEILPSLDVGGYIGDISIPDEFRYNGNTYYVRKVANNCFVNNKKITSLELPHSVFVWGGYYEPDLVKGCDNLIHYSISGVYNTYIENSNVLYKYYYKDGIVTNGKYISLLYYPSGLKDENFTIYSSCEFVSLDKFSENKYIKTVNIPSQVTSLYNGTKGKSNVENVNVSIDNTKYSSVNGIVYSKDLKTLVLYPSGRNKKDFEIPSTVTSINTDAFAFCNFRKITFKNSVKSISKYAFYDSHIDTLYLERSFSDYEFLKGLKSTSTIYVHAKDYSQVKKNFSGTIETYEKFWVDKQTKTMLGKVSFTIPKYRLLPKVGPIGPKPPKPPRISSIETSKNNTEQDYIYNKYDYRIKKVSFNERVIECDSVNCYTVDNLLPENKYVVQFDWDKYSDKGEWLESGIDHDTISTQIIKFTKNIDNDKVKAYVDYFYTYYVYSIDSLCAFVSASTDESLSPSEVGYYVRELDKYIKANEDGLVVINNLYPDSKLTLRPYAIYGEKLYNGTTQFAMNTNVPTCKVILNSTQTTALIKNIRVVDHWNKISIPSSIKLLINNKEYHWNGVPIEINNLKPGSTYEMNIQLIYDENHIVTKVENFKTISIHNSIKCTSTGPTSIHLQGYYDLGDAKIEDAYFEGNEKKEKDIIITGLKPDEKYTFKFVVKASGAIEYASIDIITSKLILETQQPINVNSNSSIVSAKTNIDNAEKNVGFEWRKIDSPDIIASKTGNGIVYEGVLEGRIFNLNSTSYYKVRPYYKTSDGTMYYGEWVGVDPSDYSYFEPIVHTYNDVVLQGLTARVRGMILQGTNDILKQGFELWMGNLKTRSSVADKQIVLCSGQSMEADFKNLNSNTIYYFRAFAETSNGIVYGQTIDFTTPILSQLNEVTNTTKNSLKLSVKINNGILIRVEGIQKGCLYRLTDMNGRCIVSGMMKSNEEWYKVAEMPTKPGVYIISINDGIYMESNKILIR